MKKFHLHLHLGLKCWRSLKTDYSFIWEENEEERGIRWCRRKKQRNMQCNFTLVARMLYNTSQRSGFLVHKSAQQGTNKPLTQELAPPKQIFFFLWPFKRKASLDQVFRLCYRWPIMRHAACSTRYIPGFLRELKNN